MIEFLNMVNTVNLRRVWDEIPTFTNSANFGGQKCDTPTRLCNVIYFNLRLEGGLNL